MAKISFVQNANYWNVFETKIGTSIIVDYAAICRFIQLNCEYCRCIAQQMYEKSILSRLGKVDSEIRGEIYASKTPCNTTASHSA